MTHVMRMSTDDDIVNATVNVSWNPINGNYLWPAIQEGSSDIPGDATIIVIAHGNNEEIGNKDPGTVDINATTFLALIQSNMADNAYPARIFISTCAENIAGFASAVSLAAAQNNIWSNTKIFGHTDPLSGDVPAYSPNSLAWTEIYQ